MDSDEDYKLQANLLKDKGNDSFQSGKIDEAIMYYTQGLDIDPDNHILLSNRSAAYMKADSKSKALVDAEKCLALAPSWSKSYARLGAAQHGLKRFTAAIDTFKLGIKIDPDNQNLWSSLRSAEEAYEVEKKERYAIAAQERAIEENIIRVRDEAKRKAIEKKEEESRVVKENEALSDFLNEINTESVVVGSGTGGTDDTDGVGGAGAEENTLPKEGEENEDSLLSDFLSSVTASKHDTAAAVEGGMGKGADTNTASGAAAVKTLTEKYVNQDLGNAMDQFNRLTGPNFQWKNLNPYYVMQLDIDATDEDIKYRYRKLSAKIHPDKLHGVANARQGFEELKVAYQKLCDEKEKSVVIMSIEHIKSEIAKERRKLIGKGMKEYELPPLEEDTQKRIMKYFADMELRKRKSDVNLRSHNAREKMFEEEEKAKIETDHVFEQEWAEGDRREKRVGNWREFQEVPESKKTKASSYKEERRDVGKHGQVKLNEWKKSWK